MGLEDCCRNNQALLLTRTSALFCEMPRLISKEQKLPGKGYENLKSPWLQVLQALCPQLNFCFGTENITDVFCTGTRFEEG